MRSGSDTGTRPSYSVSYEYVEGRDRLFELLRVSKLAALLLFI